MRVQRTHCTKTDMGERDEGNWRREIQVTRQTSSLKWKERGKREEREKRWN